MMEEYLWKMLAKIILMMITTGTKNTGEIFEDLSIRQHQQNGISTGTDIQEGRQ